MTALKIENFGGIAPRYSDRLLPQTGAVTATNCNLLSGELRGLHEAQVIQDFNPDDLSYPVARAFRIPDITASPVPMSTEDTWVPFFDPNVDFVRTPVLEDSFERYYWTGDSYANSGVPQYNTRARILAGDPPFILGIPQPVAAPTVTPADGGDDLVRAYIYTFVSAYGEEGAPSNPTIGTGTEGTWTISGFDTTVPNPDTTNITTVRVYRTVAGETTGTTTALTNYYWVADIELGTTSYSDTASDADVSNNTVLPSLTWTGPPTTLMGICAHPGGFLVGFSGRDLWMSQPYEPHAWPVQNILTTQTEIVGIAIFNSTIVVCTTSHLYYGEGMTPSNITLQMLQSFDPCISRRSIVTTLHGVYYSSPQGIIMFDGAETHLVTYPLFTREEWQEYFSPTTVYAVSYGVQYIAFDTPNSGFIFSPAEVSATFVGTTVSPAGMAGQIAPLTTLDRFSGVTAVQIDQYTGDVYLVSNSQCLLWDPPNSIPYEYTWMSKQFDLPKPVNFGAMRVKFAAQPQTVSPSELTAYTTFNDGRIAYPLNCLNLAVLNGVRTETITGYVGPQIRNPIGGSPLFPINGLQSFESAVTVNIYARDLDSSWNQVFSWSVTDERTHRLPSGFKSDGWQVELISNAPVYSFAMAETGKELRTV